MNGFIEFRTVDGWARLKLGRAFFYIRLVGDIIETNFVYV